MDTGSGIATLFQALAHVLTSGSSTSVTPGTPTPTPTPTT
ncbi:Uncharacterised protein [Nocardia otitidiscaviarum]|uniref:Uncharacterized protein n=1 Tax=Nocardia otitidiscaviarum TaxID=1823 RepID=A0A378Y8I8_9NOCA|nr:Uncharacterised protein [Nocardia otitidiscaviarum]